MYAKLHVHSLSQLFQKLQRRRAGSILKLAYVSLIHPHSFCEILLCQSALYAGSDHSSDRLNLGLDTFQLLLDRRFLKLFMYTLSKSLQFTPPFSRSCRQNGSILTFPLFQWHILWRFFHIVKACFIAAFRPARLRLHVIYPIIVREPQEGSAA